MYCDKCGHELQGFSLICPCCGGTYGEPEPDAPVEDEKPAEDEKPVEDEKPAEQEQPAGQIPPVYIEQTNGCAVAGLVFAFLFPILGLILSCLGFKRSKLTGDKYRGVAIAGIVISSILTLVSLVLIALLIVLMIAIPAVAGGTAPPVIEAFVQAIGEAFAKAIEQMFTGGTGGTETAEALFAAVPFI